MAMLNTCLNITSVVDYLLVAVRITQIKDALDSVLFNRFIININTIQ